MVETRTVQPWGSADRHRRPDAGSIPAPCTTGSSPIHPSPSSREDGLLMAKCGQTGATTCVWSSAREPTAALHRHQHANADVVRQDMPGRPGNGAPTATCADRHDCRGSSLQPGSSPGPRTSTTVGAGRCYNLHSPPGLSPGRGALCRRSSDGKSHRVPARRGRRFESGRLHHAQ